jgi:hypothetical protein
MKTMKKTVLAVLMLVAMVGATWAEPPPLVGFAGTGWGVTNGTGTSNFVVSANSVNGGVARILFLQATGGNADNVVTVYEPTGWSQVVPLTAATDTAVPLSNTNGLAATAGQFFIVRHRATDTYTFSGASAIAASTNVVLTAKAMSATTAGDILYKVEAAGRIVVGEASTLNAPAGMWIAKRPGPVALHQTGTTVALKGMTIVAGDYLKP